MAELSDRLKVPVENLLTPDYLRRVLWKPPAAEADAMGDAVAEELARLGARSWQIEIMAPMITEATGLTKAQGAVIATAPARKPLQHIVGSGLP